MCPLEGLSLNPVPHKSFSSCHSRGRVSRSTVSVVVPTPRRVLIPLVASRRGVVALSPRLLFRLRCVCPSRFRTHPPPLLHPRQRYRRHMVCHNLRPTPEARLCGTVVSATPLVRHSCPRLHPSRVVTSPHRSTFSNKVLCRYHPYLSHTPFYPLLGTTPLLLLSPSSTSPLL